MSEFAACSAGAADVGAVGSAGGVTVVSGFGWRWGDPSSAELSEPFIRRFHLVIALRTKTIGVTGPPDGAHDDCHGGTSGGQAKGLENSLRIGIYLEPHYLPSAPLFTAFVISKARFSPCLRLLNIPTIHSRITAAPK
ncbi:MAG TPA: hypothetical protein VHC19_27365 [Pirellulales bacterium]|nr:hypothetical protein [Pirellulales bacterium]